MPFRPDTQRGAEQCPRSPVWQSSHTDPALEDAGSSSEPQARTGAPQSFMDLCPCLQLGALPAAPETRHGAGGKTQLAATCSPLSSPAAMSAWP